MPSSATVVHHDTSYPEQHQQYNEHYSEIQQPWSEQPSHHYQYTAGTTVDWANTTAASPAVHQQPNPNFTFPPPHYRSSPNDRSSPESVTHTDAPSTNGQTAANPQQLDCFVPADSYTIQPTIGYDGQIPPQQRRPYEWINKNAYQCHQPKPGECRAIL